MVNTKALTLLLVICFMACVLTSCFDRSRDSEHIQYYDYGGPVMKYVHGLDEYESIKYEAVTNKPSVAIGPSEPCYRGVIVLKEDLAEDIWDKYEWEKAAPEDFEFANIDLSTLKNSTWYYSEEFEKDTIRYQPVDYIYFNGSEVLFSFRAS